MSQLLKKCALLAVCAALAFCFTTRSAHAQAVADGGVGEHLLFAYWTTDGDTNTLVAINSPLGVRNAGETMNVVRITIRDDMGKAIADFNTCLLPGDSWTAMLSADGLTVGDAGGCDGSVAQPVAAAGRGGGNGMDDTPAAGESMALSANSGYLEALLNPDGTLADDSVACTMVGSPTPGTNIPSDATVGTNTGNVNMAGCAGSQVGAFDSDGLTEDATPRIISGVATMVSAMSGFSSTYNAVALENCGDGDGNDPIDATEDNDGCLTVDNSGDNNADNDVNGIAMALAAENQDILTGRWSSISDAYIDSKTTVVLTFPVDQFSYKGRDGSANPTANAPDTADDIEGTDPLTIHVFDDTGAIALSSGELMLGQHVNMCRFGMPMDDDTSTDDGMGDDMGDDTGDDMGDDTSDDMDSGPMLSCNGTDLGELNGSAGGFRIFNNVVDNVTTAGTYGDTGTPFSDGSERTGLGLTDDTGTPDVNEAAQVAAETLNAIGLVSSYFMGSNDQQYDQTTPIQAIDVNRDSAANTLDDF